MSKNISVIHWLLGKNYNSINYMNEYIYFQILNIIIMGYALIIGINKKNEKIKHMYKIFSILLVNRLK